MTTAVIDNPQRKLSFGKPAACLLLVSQCPFVALYLHNLWSYRPHYEFFPIVIAITIYLFWSRWPSDSMPRDPKPLLETCFWLGAALAAIAGLALYSPLLAAVSMVLSVGALLINLGVIRYLWGVWAMLWLVITPARLDLSVLQVMQSVTSRANAHLMDLAGVEHLRSGNVVEVPGKELFVAEACSGLHSQLVLFACTTIFVVVMRRPLLTGLLLMLTSLVWATIVNVCRVFVIAVAQEKANLDLTSGWQHETLGLALLAVGFLLVFSTDQLLHGFLLARITQAGIVKSKNPWVRTWNKRFALKPKAQEPDREKSTMPWGPTTRAAMFITTVFAAIGMLQLASLSIAPAASRLDQNHLQVSEDTLGATVNGWTRASFENIQRDSSSNEGEFSKTWGYQAKGCVVQVSLDYPFLGWHELTNCYRGRGWQIESRKVRQQDYLGPVYDVALRKPNGERARLMFTVYAESGVAISDAAVSTSSIRQKLKSNPLMHAVNGTLLVDDSLTFQIQQFLPQVATHERESDLVFEQFLHFREQLHTQWVNQIQSQ